MNKIGIVPILCGLFAGGVVVALLVIGRPESPPLREKEAPPEKTESAGTTALLEKENRELRDRILELEGELESLTTVPVPSPETKEPAKRKKEKQDLHTLFYRLGEKGLSAYGGKAFRELARQLKAAGEEGRELLIERLKNGGTAQERFLAAALLEELRDPAAIPGLADALAEDPDDIVRRMSSHAIAVIGTDGAREPLLASMNDDKDWGVRVNSAYGLAKLGDAAGLAMLKESYVSAETPAEYRLAILSGLADVADPTTAPIFREILSGSKDMSYILTSIMAVQKMKDTGSLPELQAILTSGHSDMIKEKAEEAIFNIQQ